MKYAPWQPPLPADREFYQRFLAIGRAFHDGSLQRQAMDEWKAHQLRAVLELTSTRSPFYSERLKGIDLVSVKPDDLSSLPFTTKTDLREQMLDIVSGDMRDATYFFQTTGTTGPSTPCPRGVREILASNFNAAMSIQNILNGNPRMPDKPIFGMLCTNELTAAGKTYSEVCKDLGMLVLDAWPGSPAVGWRTCVEVLRQLEVDVILATPGLAAGLAKAARKYGYDPRSQFGIKTILGLGEVLSEPMKRNISALWGGADVYDFVYGSQEAFIMAAASVDDRMVPHLPNYIWEIIDPDTGASSSSGYGELCLTCLVDGIKPLVRYRTGDLVELTLDPDRPTAAASTLKLFGRTRDAIAIGTARITARELETLALDSVEQCVGYQYRLEGQRGCERVHLMLELMPSDGARSDPDLAAIVRRISDRVGADCEVEIVDALDAHTRAASWVSWKAARIVDLRTGDDLHEREADEREILAAKSMVASLPQL